MPSACPFASTIVELTDGALSPDQRVGAQEHLGGCAFCRDLVAERERSAPPLHPHVAADADPSAPGIARPPLATVASLLGHPSDDGPVLRDSDEGRSVPRGAAPGDRLDEYQLVRRLGQGAMGEVFLAHDERLDREVAIKVIAKGKLAPTAKARFLVEARAAARLQHPNALTIHRIGEYEGEPYIVSELLRGTSLDELATPLPHTRALEVAVALARGLAAAHRAGILHRDIKPANAMLTASGEVKLLDFGLAKLTDAGPDAPPISAPSVAPPSSRRPHVVESPGEDRPLPSSSPMTADGVVVGTPLYMAPERWLGEPATRRSDVYSLGALIYELYSGAAPLSGNLRGATIWEAIQHDARPLAEAVPGVDPRLAALIDRCLRRSPAERPASGDAVREGLEELLPTAPRESIPEGNPYRGLRAFEAEDRALFFGRGVEIRAVLDRMRAESFVLVAGESGVGKSSLCRAGVVPQILDGALGEGRRWSVTRLVPGRRPLVGSCTAIASQLGVDEQALEPELIADPAEIGRRLRVSLGGEKGWLLFVDQLEELFTSSVALADAAAMGALLGELAVGIPGVRVLATIRVDMLARARALPLLGDEIARALYLLGPLSAEAAREVVVAPARANGVRFESEALVAELSSFASTGSALPLVQFALAELWEARGAGQTVLSAAQLASIGGVSGALARHADDVLAGLPPLERSAARRVLTQLVSSEGLGVRQNEPELGAERPVVRAALDALVRGRLLAASDTVDGPAYQMAHEALIDGWPTLRRWLHEDEDGRALRQRLSAAAGEWERLGRSREALWGGRQIGEVARLNVEDLPPRDAAFIEASRRAARRARFVSRASIVAVAISLASVYVGVRLQSRRETSRKIAEAVSVADGEIQGTRAQSLELDRLRADALARYDAGDWAGGDRLWTRVLALTDDVGAAYARASRALEAAMLLDPTASGGVGTGGSGRTTRERLADLTVDRIALSNLHGSPTREGEDLLERLKLYDPSGARVARFARPAHVALRTTPPGASISIERAPRRLGDLGNAPVDATLERGSYVLTARLAGHVDVRYPVLLRAGEVLDLALDLPTSAQVPDGFVYVAPGRFLFGSASDDDLRRGFLETVPQHELRTGGFLIGRTEVTFADWISFLRALPPSERAAHTPRVQLPQSSKLVGASLALEEDTSGRWTLRFRATTTTYEAREGEPFHYGERDRRGAQDWLRFPVAGVTVDDVEGYARWLDSTRRVPGARLCDEHEWERAARGADGRVYPHGDALAADDANIDETYGRREGAFGPDEVGSHPASTSPFGVVDMVGNVFELVYSAASPRVSAGATATPRDVLMRGGGWYQNAMTARSVNRFPVNRAYRHVYAGARICASLR